ncbi:MAG: ribosomal protein, partial [Chthonomonadaceae bacterium]|nr:ribosomal protein [Chthonomonadaceae bacterium]
MAQDTVAETLERPREHRENRKKNRGRKVEANQAQAIAKFIRVPPRKARLVIDAVRGRYAQDALAFLRFVPNRAAGYISKVLASAVANAANNHELDPNRLKLIEARVDEGPRMKRVQPRAQGRAYRILKRMSHITITVQEVEAKPKKPKKAAATRTATPRTTAPRAAKPTPAPAPAVEETKPIVAAEETTPVVPVEETTPETAPEVTETPAEETTTE